MPIHLPALFAALLAALLAPLAAAQPYPTKTIRMIAPYPPGGGLDAVARVIAPALTEQMGQQVVVDNRGGASGRIGTELAARSAPDGHTVLIGNVGPNAILPAVYAKLPYDAIRDFIPVSLISNAAYVLVVHPSLNVRSIKEMIALARARKGQLDFASSGVLGGPHMAGELFNYLTGVQMVHVPYKGNGPALTDLLGGQVATLFASLPSGVPHVKTGRLRGLGVTSEKRVPSIADIPAIGETVKGYAVGQWYGALLPAAAPREVVSRLNAEIVKAVTRPDIAKRLSDMGADPATSTPEEFMAHIRGEIERWRKVVQAAGIKPE